MNVVGLGSEQSGLDQRNTSLRPADLLCIDGLRVSLKTSGGSVAIIDDVGFTVRAGETVGVVGESGCGKTTTALAVVGLLPKNTRIDGGSVTFAGQDLTAMKESGLQRVRGAEIGFVSQQPSISLNPAFRVGWQIAEAVRTHMKVPRSEARRRAVELLGLVRLPNPAAVARRYPHELSGGMAQRVAIARALAGEPRLLVADEPTTALDVTVQAEILSLLRELQVEKHMAILIVTHDWGVVADICDRAVVMYAGQVIEQADVSPMFHRPGHPYTKALLAANPLYATGAEFLPAIPGEVPQPGKWPQGCHFQNRCQYATSECGTVPIQLVEIGLNRISRCIRHEVMMSDADREVNE